MTYTFWHRGVLMGESALAHTCSISGPRGGIFHPTPYGLTLMPRVTCGLTADQALRRDLAATGKSVDSFTPEEAAIFIKSRPHGLLLLDIGRVMREVELRSPHGTRLDYVAMSFLDLEEFRKYGRILGVNHDAMLAKLPSSTQAFTVSVQLRQEPFPSTRRVRRISRRERVQ